MILAICRAIWWIVDLIGDGITAAQGFLCRHNIWKSKVGCPGTEGAEGQFYCNHCGRWLYG